MNLRSELEQLRYEIGIQREVDCSYAENQQYKKMLQNNQPLPNGILRRNPDSPIEYDCFYRIEKNTLSKDELAEYLQCKQLAATITIKKCVVFFTILTVISLFCSLILALSMLTQ